MAPLNNKIVKVTKKWIAEFVIKLNLCPFAHVSFNKDAILYKTTHAIELTTALDETYNITSELQNSKEYSNAFCIFTLEMSFDQILELKDVYDVLLEELQLDTIFQSVVFHPEFVFNQEKSNHPGNFVNRSPYPMLHILRSDEVARATASIEDSETIPLNNKQKLEREGYNFLYNNLQSFY